MSYKTTIIFGILSAFFLFYDITWLGLVFMALCVISYLVIRSINQEEEVEKKSPPNTSYYLYQNHCWCCKNPIDSRHQRKCPKCRKYYICSHCGKCKCDSPWFENQEYKERD